MNLRTAQTLRLLVHFYIYPEPPEQMDAPAMQRGIAHLLRLGLIVSKDDTYVVTPLGDAHVSKLIDQECVQRDRGETMKTPPVKENTEYIGDGLYAEQVGPYAVRVISYNGMEVLQEIFMELGELTSLVQFCKRKGIMP